MGRCPESCWPFRRHQLQKKAYSEIEGLTPWELEELYLERLTDFAELVLAILRERERGQGKRPDSSVHAPPTPHGLPDSTTPSSL